MGAGGGYLCSVRTTYRLLAANDEACERRQQRRHPAYSKPKLLATGPIQVWHTGAATTALTPLIMQADRA